MFLPPCAVAERRAVAGALRTVWTSKRNSVDVVVAWFVHSGPLTSNSGLLLLLATPRATPDCSSPARSAPRRPSVVQVPCHEEIEVEVHATRQNRKLHRLMYFQFDGCKAVVSSDQ